MSVLFAPLKLSSFSLFNRNVFWRVLLVVVPLFLSLFYLIFLALEPSFLSYTIDFFRSSKQRVIT